MTKKISSSKISPSQISPSQIRLGVNLDHIATLRNARGGSHPDLIAAAQLAEQAGADGITAHLREDRRHIKDEDLLQLKQATGLPLNMEMAATDEMLEIALTLKPNACCLVPEKRAELTTEGGLNAAAQANRLKGFTDKLKSAGIRTSFFIDPDGAQIEAAARCGADIIELHTGGFSESLEPSEFQKLEEAAALAHRLGLELHAGHGLNYASLELVATLPRLKEVNVGHFIIGEAVFAGLTEVIAKMKVLL